MKMISLALALLVILLSACDTVEIGQAKDVNPDAVWQQYNIWYNEADDSANFQAQFRFAGPNGTTLVLDSFSNVMFDDRLLVADSSIYPGAYYLQRLHPHNAIGTHVFSYTDINGKMYKNTVNFNPPQLQNDFQVPINPRSDLKLRFSGLADKELVDISLSDTAANNVDIDSSFSILKQSVSIPAAQLAKMAAGPLTITIRYDKKLPLQQATKEGGQIHMLYTLQPLTVTMGTSSE